MHRFFAAFLCVIAGVALGDEGPKAAQTEISEARFSALVKRISADDPTTIEFRDRVRLLAREHAVRRTGKIFDIKPLQSSIRPRRQAESVGDHAGGRRAAAEAHEMQVRNALLFIGAGFVVGVAAAPTGRRPLAKKRLQGTSAQSRTSAIRTGASSRS